MSDPLTFFPRRETRLKPEFAHLYPGIAAGRWEPAAVMADRMAAWLPLHPQTVLPASERILSGQHFEFRGKVDRPASLPEARSRREDH